MRELCEQVSKLQDAGKEVVIVTSGAIASGRSRLELNGQPLTLELQQASASVGQGLLMGQYNSFFMKRGKTIAQLLFTQEDFRDEKRLKNLVSTLQHLFKMHVIPIVNENDAVATEELDHSGGKDERSFGDNDELSALVACAINADLLLLLSNVDGLLDKEKNVLDFVEQVSDDLSALDSGVVTGRGGLATKLASMRYAAASGVCGVIANGKTTGVVARLFNGENVGTIFAPYKKKELGIQTVRQIALKAKFSQQKLAQTSEDQRNKTLLLVAAAIEKNADNILKENEADVAEAVRSGATQVFLQRLKLEKPEILALSCTLRKIAALESANRNQVEWTLENGLKIRKVRVPLGVILLIYESRPNVTVEAGALAIKSGNSIILKGGWEARRTNKELVNIFCQAVAEAGLPLEVIQQFNGSRMKLAELLKQGDCIDLVMPRGGNQLVNFVRRASHIPVIYAGGGVCHLYIDEAADFKMATNILLNAKVQKPSVCNSIETLLVHEKIAEEFLPLVAEKLTCAGVELRCCEKSAAILSAFKVKLASEEDFGKEFSDLVLSIKISPHIADAIQHINRHGTKHSEAIVTESKQAAEKFLQEVDASTVYWNASTRFTDGEQFGFGAELGVSTQKLHVRGPVGLDALSTYKYEIYGTGQVRS